VKQAILARSLALRAARPAIFATGEHVPLTIEGPLAAHVLAFARVHRDGAVLAVVTRLPARLLHGSALPLVPPEEWGGTELVLPRVVGESRWRNALTGTVPGIAGDRLPLSDVLARLPVALLEGT
jgi:(1->4)-alpha-D-glucan 1-alpha-D-glucosylmutase